MDTRNKKRPSYDEQLGHFSSRLRKAIGTKSMRQFARESGIADSVLRRYLSGDSLPGSEALLKISSSSGISVDWLLTGRTSFTVSEPESAYGFDEEFAYVNELRAKRGNDDEIVFSSKSLAFRREWLEQQGIEPRNLAVVRHRGDTMQPTLLDGDHLLVRVFHRREGSTLRLGTESPSELTDGLYLIRMGHSQKVLRLCIRSPGFIEFISDNHSYPSRTMPLSDVDVDGQITVIGSVLWIGRWLNR